MDQMDLEYLFRFQSRVPELQFSCNENMEYMELSKDRVRFA